MGKFKPKWQKTNIPKHIKIELWRVIKDNPTQKTREQAVACLGFSEIDEKWVRTSRDTFNKLEQELSEMPDEEVNSLPEDIQMWTRNLREEQTLSQPNHLTLSQKKLEHWKELSDAAMSISEKLRHIMRYSPITDEKVGELAVNYDEPDLLELLDDPPARYLLSHMKSELPGLENLKTWADLGVKNITKELLDALAIKARRKEFKGTCDICRQPLN